MANIYSLTVNSYFLQKTWPISKDEEKVPCQTDAVIFEPISTFMVQGLAAVKQIDVAQQVRITKFTLTP